MMVPPALKVPPAPLVRKVIKVLRVSPVQLVLRGTTESQVLLAPKVLLEMLARLELRDQQVRKARMGLLVRLGHKGLLVLMEPRVLLALKVQQDLSVFRVIRAPLELQDSPVQMGLLAQLALKVLKAVLALRVQPALRVPLDLRVPLE